jgi:hypothetical protein
MRHDQSADQCAARGAKGLSGGDQSVGETAFVRRYTLTQKLRIARVGDALADAENDAQNEEDREAGRQPCERGGQGPDGEAASEHQRARGGEVAAIEVIDEYRSGQKPDHAARRCR